jgi:glycosyltransferase involved in cell wall biosynthesis
MVDTVTVIVPTKNEADNIGFFLATLPDEICLIVVDDSDDDTPELISTLRPQNTRLLRLPGNISEARQEGASQARTPWLLFADADVEFAEGYFNLLPELLAVDMVYGTKLSRDDYQSYYHRFRSGQRMLDWLGIPAATGSNLLVRRDVFHAVGGFDLTLSVNEDSELAWRIKRNGYCVRFAPQLVVFERDHRRLAQGTWRKTFHSLIRCTLLFAGLMPQKWRRDDWGYWTERETSARENHY